MITKTLAFRAPEGWSAYIDREANRFGFTSSGELLSLVLTESACRALAGGTKFKGRVTGPTTIMGCRLPEATYKAISEYCKRTNETVSVWAAVSIHKWLEQLQKQDEHQQKKLRQVPYCYQQWCQNFARDYRVEIARLQHEIGL